MTVIHTKLLIAAAVGGRSNPVIDQSYELAGGGGGGRGIRASIRCNVEKRAGRRRGHNLRGNDVPVAAQALANPFQWGGIRRRHPLRRMSRLPGVRSAPSHGSIVLEVWSSPKVHATGTAAKSGPSCFTPGRRGYSILRHSHLRTDRDARLSLSQITSPARPRARAWDVADGREQLCAFVARDFYSSPSTPCAGVTASRPSTTSQSRAARVSNFDRGARRRARNLRRAG